MIQLPRHSAFSRALLIAAVVGLGTGCTLFDDYLPGTPFTLDQPAAEVTLQGEINVDQAQGETDTCPAGRTVLWGMVRNTGDVDVVDVYIDVDAFGPSGAFLGTYRDHVYSGEVVAGTDPTQVDTASTSLEVDQAGTFAVCAPLASGSVARTEYRTEFCYYPSVSPDGVQELICQ